MCARDNCAVGVSGVKSRLEANPHSWCHRYQYKRGYVTEWTWGETIRGETKSDDMEKKGL